MKTISPQAHAQRLRDDRTAIRPRHSRDENHVGVRINHQSFRELTVEERLTVLARIAGLFRDMAEQAEDERRLLALEELAA